MESVCINISYRAVGLISGRLGDKSDKNTNEFWCENIQKLAFILRCDENNQWKIFSSCLSVSAAEADVRRGSGPTVQQHHGACRHDDGHPGDGSVSVQRQADGGES